MREIFIADTDAEAMTIARTALRAQSEHSTALHVGHSVITLVETINL